MKNIIKQEIKQEIFEYLNDLIKDKMYLYMFQAKGKYQAKDLHSKINHILEELLEKEIIDDFDCEATSINICNLIDKELNSYMLEKTTENIYLLDFNVFSFDVSAKIKNLIEKHKCSENSFDKMSINKKLAL